MRREIEDIHLDDVRSFSDIMDSFTRGGGFVAKRMGEATEVMESMLRDGECTVFLSFTADLVATGFRGVLADMVEKGLVAGVVTTCGTLDHDIARTVGHYSPGEFGADDDELLERGVHRLGNLYIRREDYGQAVESFMRPLLEESYGDDGGPVAVWKLVRRIGESLDDEDSILYRAASEDVPVFVPGPLDGAVGSQMWLFNESHPDFSLDLFADEKRLESLIYESERTGGVILGGGISKHHLLWWNQFKGGLDYAVQVTTGIELDGSLTGASLSEAVSWSKVRPEGRYVDVWAEVTSVFPFMLKAVYERLRGEVY